jgi:hypothetical protein
MAAKGSRLASWQSLRSVLLAQHDGEDARGHGRVGGVGECPLKLRS